MIDWMSLLHNSLWLIGLAICLSALGIANYLSHRERVRLRQKLNEPGFQLAVSIGMVAFCVGLLFSSQTWWERALWVLLACAFAVWGYQQIPSSKSPSTRPVPRRRLTGPRLGWSLVFAGLLMIGGWMAITGVQLVIRARSLQEHIQYLEGLSQGTSGEEEIAKLRAAGDHLSGMRQDLDIVQAWIGPVLPAGRLLRWIPRYGGDLAAAPDLLDMAVGVAASGDRVFQSLSPALALFGDSTDNLTPGQSLGEKLLPILVAAQPELQAAQGQLAIVNNARARVDPQTLSPRVANLLERLDRYLPWLEVVVDGALLAPSLLGEEGPRTYLIVAQNNHELRATGGFISGVGLMRVNRGLLESLTFEDSYAVDNLQVPHDLTPLDFQRVLGGQLWFFRDTNWDAHFPTSARRALDVYAQDRGVQAQGLITLDLVALQYLVEGVSPLLVEGISKPVTEENIVQVIQQQWDEGSSGNWRDWYAQRKDFMGQIAAAAMDRVVAGHNLRALRLARALKSALDEKHLLIYIADPRAASLLRERNWDGALIEPPLPSDTLLVVDTNVGFNKVDAVIARSIQYKVDLGAAEGPQARLTLTYDHLSRSPAGACVQEAYYGDTYADMMKRCYWDYVRVYVPGGSQLLNGPDPSVPPGSLWAQGSDDQPDTIRPVLVEDGWPVWTAFFALATMEEKTLTFEYRLPDGLVTYDADGLAHYRLRVQKQPGTEAVPLQVEIGLPPGAELVSSTPVGLPLLDTDLRIDRELEVIYRERDTGP